MVDSCQTTLDVVFYMLEGSAYLLLGNDETEIRINVRNPILYFWINFK